MNKTIKRTTIPSNYEYDEINHTDTPIFKPLDWKKYDVIHVIELHYPYTDIEYLKGLVKEMRNEEKEGLTIGLVLLGDNVDTPKNGKLRMDYPKLTAQEVADGFINEVLPLIKRYVIAFMLSNHDFEFMQLTDSFIEKKAYNLWQKMISLMKESGVFVTKRLIRVELKGKIKAIFEHEHLVASSVKNRAWQYYGFQYRIFAGRHESWMNENIYDGDMQPCTNISVPPAISGQLQYNEERMNPHLIARSLRIFWNERLKDWSWEEE